MGKLLWRVSDLSVPLFRENGSVHLQYCYWCSGKTDAAVWHGYKTSDGSMKGSNTILICPAFFKKQGAATSHQERIQKHSCGETGSQKLMELRSECSSLKLILPGTGLHHGLTSCVGAIILRELSQTSHVGLRPRDKNMVESTAESQSGGAQDVLKGIDTNLQLKQVDAELFNHYAIRKFGQVP